MFEQPWIPPDQRRTERAFLSDFNAAYPGLFGSVLNTLSGMLRELPNVTLGSVPRMADFAHAGVAIERALRWPTGSFMAAYEGNRRNAADSGIESDPVALAVLAHLDVHPRGFTGTMTAALNTLALAAQRIQLDTTSRAWPRLANQLSGRLRRVTDLLRERGVVIETWRAPDRTRTRMVSIHYANPEPDGDPDVDDGHGPHPDDGRSRTMKSPPSLALES